ncbi:MAG: hypothetical protein EBU90_19775 [Proteobacteria bacterium]|nr:hypothetical protein [Pseudomonadota bacterium]
MPIQGTVPVGGSFAPTDSADSFGTHNDKWGIGGYRVVKTITDRNAIPVNESNLLNLDDTLASGRRKLGMMVYVSDENKFYVLTIDAATWDGYTESQKVTALIDNDNWLEFVGGGGGADTGDIRFIGSWIKNVDTGNIFISPQDGTTWLTLPSDDQASAGAYVQLASSDPDSAGVYITTFNGTWNNWEFNNDGILTVPGRISFGTTDMQSIGKGTVELYSGTNNGISLFCAVGFELNWQNGFLTKFDNSANILPIFSNSIFEYADDYSNDYTDRSLIDKGYLTAQGYLTTISGITAGGDLSGTYTDPKVIALQARSVADIIPINGQILQWNGSAWIPGAVPTGGSGGGGIAYYFNFGTSAASPTTNLPTTPNTPKQLGRTGVVAGSSYTSGTLSQVNYNFIVGFVTDVGDPSITEIPAGLWDFNIWAASNANSANQTILKLYVYKYNGSTAPGPSNLLAESDDISIYDPSVVAQYIAAVVLPQTTILSTDRIYIAIHAKATANNRTVSLYFGDATPSHVHTTIPSVAGTGLVKVVNGVYQTPASTLVDADVASNAAIAVTKLAAGTANQVLRMSSGGSPVIGWGAIDISQSAAVTGTLAVTNGGTGLTSFAQGDLIYSSDTNTLLALPKNTTATRYLSNTGTNNNPAWAQVNLSNGVTGTLPVGNGGTGLTTIAATSILVANTLDTYTTLAPGPGQSVRINTLGTAWEIFTPGVAGSIALNSVGAATGSASINNGNNQITWNWNSLTTTVGGFVIASSSVTSGAVMSISSTSTAATLNSQRALSVSLSGANSNSNQVTIASDFINTHSGTGAINIAGRFAASGGATNIPISIDNASGGTGVIDGLNLVYRSAGLIGEGLSLTWQFNNAYATPVGRIAHFRANTGTYDFTFSTFLGSLNEVMRITGGTRVGIGTGATVSAKLHTIATTEQLRLGYDASNYLSITVGITGGVTLDAVGSGAGFTFSDNITLPAGISISTATTGAGGMFGTTTSQLVGFHGTAGTIQRAAAAQAAVATTAATQTTPWGYSTQAQADGVITLLNEIRTVLVNKGLMKGSA